MTKMMTSRLTKPILASVALCVAAIAAPLVGPVQARPAATVPFDGEIAQFYRVRGAHSDVRPLQKPHPLFMFGTEVPPRCDTSN